MKPKNEASAISRVVMERKENGLAGKGKNYDREQIIIARDHP